ncbi:PEP-CTERM sorting domain-containing protein [Massilia sp. CCM 8733]|uniref:PEP-CTERM sorting domain-containing protein n=1 Tax=Massilia mucilaginosa TaxID=2609282 RepID=A0ABX0NLC2_9BURK|nr:PEP-CTERM sorting domain-containing protein [Massilia mucilaginosa]NHZ87603.1 PEP-CTERM sorting domain-containing protein [Massilia mucilaginosa]
MHAFFTFSRALIATAAMAACGGAVAATTGSISVTNVQFQIIDLTPDDGISAGISFTGFTGHATSLASNHSTWTFPSDQQYTKGDLITSTTALGRDRGTSAISQAGGLHLDVERHDSADKTSVGAKGSTSYGFVLAPNTKVIVTGSAQIKNDVSGPLPDNAYKGHKAFNLLRLTLRSYSHTLGKYEKTFSSGVVGPELVDIDDQFSLSTSNTGGADKELWFNTSAILSGANPVPEPATYAMFGVGLLMLGAMARRKRAPR